MAAQAASLRRNAVWMFASFFGKNAVAISVSPCVRSGVRRKPASAETPTCPRVDFARVTSMRGNTHVASAKGLVTLDARPSDAIALALRTGARIFVDEAVIRDARSFEMTRENVDVGRLQRWLENLSDDDLGKYKM